LRWWHDWQHRGLVTLRILYLILVRLAGWMALPPGLGAGKHGGAGLAAAQREVIDPRAPHAIAGSGMRSAAAGGHVISPASPATSAGNPETQCSQDRSRRP
jgi:hypothetical protein